jgi:cytochrome c oxidase cbb3-type subunit 2
MDVFTVEGCWTCHTRLTRNLDWEVLREGRPTTMGEFLSDAAPRGRQRIGPDLAQQGKRHRVDWQAAHLWQPRDILGSSMMPSHRWLFAPEVGTDPPALTAAGRALLAYLAWVGTDPPPPLTHR